MAGLALVSKKGSAMKKFTFLLLCFVFAVGCGRDNDKQSVVAERSVSSGEVWTCSMHPQIKMPQFGKCPICAMDLIPATAFEEGSEREVKMTDWARKLASIQVAPVERRFLTRKMVLQGKTVYDETGVHRVTARFPGRIDRLYTDFYGMNVKKGQHLAAVYSPELLSAQQELIQALSLGERSVKAAARKLSLLGISEQQIKKVKEQKRVFEHIDIYVPADGVIVEKSVEKGDYVKTGSRMLTLANLSYLWVKLDVFESDISWIQYGQQVDITTVAMPGEVFSGMVSFIDPEVDAKKRTLGVRVTVRSDGRLKSGMLIKAELKAELGAEGVKPVIDLAGVVICPMHRGIMRKEEADCDICGMPLEPAEKVISLAPKPFSPVLAIPASAPLVTGKRAVVYVQKKRSPGVFEGREVTLGVRAGKWYEVKSGLKEGELVVVNGNFKIDSELQLRAAPSMLSQPDESDEDALLMNLPPKPFVVDKSFVNGLQPLFDSYFAIHQQLSRDKFEKVAEIASVAEKVLTVLDSSGLSSRQRAVWKLNRENLLFCLRRLLQASDLPQARDAYSSFSTWFYVLTSYFGVPENTEVRRFFCPMAFNNRGEYWLQNRAGVENPFFGSQMLKCGEEVQQISVKDASSGNQH